MNEKKEYINKERRYNAVVTTITTRRFGPSGSSKKKNINLVSRRDVRTKIG
jgi:hypothetical protein